MVHGSWSMVEVRDAQIQGANKGVRDLGEVDEILFERKERPVEQVRLFQHHPPARSGPGLRVYRGTSLISNPPPLVEPTHLRALSGFGMWGSGCGVQGIGFRIWGPGCGVEVL